ncbi:MAG TPA: porphobilinogen synthase, partial [Verrucomicrobiae bacterium]|nr:porphobilinogen synthase [Verrucomicrobiae bacterium]
MRFPIYRPRRLRQNPKLRALVRETELSVSHLVMPLFVREGSRLRKPISS